MLTYKQRSVETKIHSSLTISAKSAADNASSRGLKCNRSTFLVGAKAACMAAPTGDTYYTAGFIVRIENLIKPNVTCREKFQVSVHQTSGLGWRVAHAGERTTQTLFQTHDG